MRGRNATRLITILNGGGLPYWQKAANVQSAGQIEYYRANDTTGTTAVDISSKKLNGTYVSVALANATGPDGVNCAYFDGTGYLKFYSAGLNTNFNGQEFSVSVWFKPNSADFWTDGLFHTILIMLVDGNNYLTINKIATPNNTLQFYCKSGGTAKNVQSTAAGGRTNWIHACMTNSKSAGASGELKAYIDAVQVGTTQTGLGSWTGNLTSNRCNIGANAQTPTETMLGWISNFILWSNVIITPAEVGTLANP